MVYKGKDYAVDMYFKSLGILYVFFLLGIMKMINCQPFPSPLHCIYCEIKVVANKNNVTVLL